MEPFGEGAAGGCLVRGRRHGLEDCAGRGQPILAPAEGCHVNLLAPDGWVMPEPIAGKVATPDSPVCVFVG